MKILHLYATIHPPSRKFSLMPITLITSICSFHHQHYHHLVILWGIYLLVSHIYPHFVSPMWDYDWILCLSTLVRYIVFSFWYYISYPFLLSPPSEILGRPCAFIVISSIFGSICLLHLLRASVMSHLYVPWILFSSTLSPIKTS
jgi:hypothetical protein